MIATAVGEEQPAISPEEISLILAYRRFRAAFDAAHPLTSIVQIKLPIFELLSTSEAGLHDDVGNLTNEESMLIDLTRSGKRFQIVALSDTITVLDPNVLEIDPELKILEEPMEQKSDPLRVALRKELRADIASYCGVTPEEVTDEFIEKMEKDAVKKREELKQKGWRPISASDRPKLYFD